jgi:LuxR family maltose regulon positive regulatory protein
VLEPSPLLTTKLFVPQARPGLVARSRLLERLDAGQTCKLTLISAPAGFGKTTLVAAWLARKPRRVAWLSLDEGDNDPARFLAHLGAAFQRADVSLDDLQALRQPAAETVLTAFINRIGRKTEALTLVLDDYHAIGQESVHQVLTFLLEHLPPTLRLVITTRADPPLPLARLRGRGELLELRASELRFNEAEAGAFLNEVMGLELSAADVAALEARTEGWIVGLQLAALSLEGEANRTGFIRAFAGDNRYVLDYLLDEVFSRQEEQVQAFLLKTAILERLCGPLCDAVVGGSSGEGQRMLERLERAGLFLVPLDDRRRWYRYHHLFADLLCHRLHLTQPEAVAALRKRAAAWYEEAGHHGEALGQLFIAEEFAWAARLIEEAGPATLWERGEVATVRGWLAKLPGALVRERPKLLLLRVWVSHAMGEIEAIEPLLEEAEARLHAEQEAALQGEVAALRGLLASVRGDTSAALEQFLQALRVLPASDPYIRGRALTGLAECHYLTGDLAAAARRFAEAGRAGHNLAAALYSLWWLVNVQTLQGRLNEAEGTCKAMKRLIAEHGSAFSGMDLAEVQLARLLCERGELDASEAMFQNVLQQGDRTSNPRVFLVAYLALARTLGAKGEWAAALASLDEAERIVSDHRITWTWGLPPIAAYRARLQLQQSEVAAAARWAEAQGLSPTDEIGYAREVEHYTLVRLLLSQGRLDEAEQLLTRLLALAEAGGRAARAIEARMLQALVLHARGALKPALEILATVLEQAEPEGYLRLFADEGERMAALLREAAMRNLRPAYVARLLAACGHRPLPAKAHALIEPLSKRELDVLRLMAGRLSNKEIAVELALSSNTVKWYARSIFEKLGVHKRRSAVAKARELGIL